MISNEQVSRWGLTTNVILLSVSGVQFLRDLAVSTYSPSGPSASKMASGSSERLYTLLFLGVLAAVAGGILWSRIEKVAGWHIGAGGDNEGWSAVAASMSMTLPLIIVPILYQYFGHTRLVLPRHLVAGGTIIVANAFGWLFIYGWKSVGFRGVKELIEPLPSSASLRERLIMEVVFTAINFCSIVLVYRAIVDSQFGALTISLINKVLIPAIVYFSGMSVFTFVKYPESIVDKTWIHIRGVVAGLLLVVTLTGGMFM
jgi:hypothetical protein